MKLESYLRMGWVRLGYITDSTYSKSTASGAKNYDDSDDNDHDHGPWRMIWKLKDDRLSPEIKAKTTQINQTVTITKIKSQFYCKKLTTKFMKSITGQCDVK